MEKIWNWQTFTAQIGTKWKRNEDECGGCYLQVRPEKQSATDAAVKQLAAFQGAILFIVTLEPLSPWRRTTHTRTSLSVVLHLVLSAELNRLFVLSNTAENETLCNWHKTVTGAHASPTVLIWKPRWDSLRGIPLKFSPLGLFRLPPGRCAPFSWVSRPPDSAAPTTTLATLREA